MDPDTQSMEPTRVQVHGCRLSATQGTAHRPVSIGTCQPPRHRGRLPLVPASLAANLQARGQALALTMRGSQPPGASRLLHQLGKGLPHFVGEASGGADKLWPWSAPPPTRDGARPRYSSVFRLPLPFLLSLSIPFLVFPRPIHIVLRPDIYGEDRTPIQTCREERAGQRTAVQDHNGPASR